MIKNNNMPIASKNSESYLLTTSYCNQFVGRVQLILFYCRSLKKLACQITLI